VAETTETPELAVPSFLLVTFDTTRADRIGAYGYKRANTPTLDRLAAQGVLFESALAPTPTTLPSHASILTGTYPTAHGIHDNAGFVLTENATLVSEVFRRRGWRTAAFAASYVLDASFGLDQGFEIYRGPPPIWVGGIHSARRSAREVVTDAIAWFAALDPSEHFFVWIHFYDPHQPLAERDEQGNEIQDPYQEAISIGDQELGRLLTFLERRGMTENLLTVTTADHGESIGEHGEKTHGIFLYQAVMRVPLIFAGGPASRWKGVRVGRPVTTAAIAPTLLELARLPRSEMPEARLSPLLSMDRENPTSEMDEALYLQSFMPYYAYRWHGFESVIWKGYKLIQGSSPELYALKDDPAESRDLADEQPSRVGDLKARLAGLIAEHQPLGWAESRNVDEKESRLLASLGYVVGTVGGNPLDATLPDPREKLGEIEILAEATRYLTRWFEVKSKATTSWQRDQEGRKFLETAKAIAMPLQESEAPDILLLRAVIEYEFGNPSAAIPLLKQIVREAPRAATFRGKLAEAYWKAGRREDATREQRTAISLAPQQPVYYQALIQWHLDSGDIEQASRWMDRFSDAMKDATPEHLEAKNWIAEQQRLIHASKRTD
jgi:arylsulfatase A-like enzyme